MVILYRLQQILVISATITWWWACGGITEAPSTVSSNTTTTIQVVQFSCASENMFVELSPLNLTVLWGRLTIASSAGAAYVGTIGIVSSGMDGSMISCYGGGGGVAAACFDVDGFNYGVKTSNGRFTVLEAASSNSTHATLSFFTSVSRFSYFASSCLIAYCWSAYDASAGLPQEHRSSSDRGIMAVDFTTGVVIEQADPFANRATAYMTVVGAMVIVLVVSALLSRGLKLQLRPPHIAAVQLVVPLFILTMIVIVVAYAVKDFHNKTKPTFRALGEASAFILSLIMIPTTKHVGLGLLVGSSHERLLFLHPFLGVTLFATMTLHMGGMFRTFTNPADLFRDTNSAFGFVAWVLMLGVTLPALTIRRSAYFLFRVTHCLFIFVLLFAALHHNELFVMLIPGFGLWVIDVALRLRSAFAANATMKRAHYDRQTGVIMLEVFVDWTEAPPPASYVQLLIPSLSPLMHPFSVALTAAADDSMTTTTTSGCRRRVTLYIKNNGRGTFTGALADLCEAIHANSERDGCPWPAVSVFGPYGRLQVPIEACRHVVLVSGGIGITPMLSILENIGTSNASLMFPRLQSVRFIWAARDMQAVHLFRSTIDGLAAKCDPKISVKILCFCTRRNPPIPDVQLDISSQRPAAGDVCGEGRPDVGTIFDELNGEDRVGCYICGPQSLQKRVVRESSARQFWVHCETFEI
jgi:predicted ferric reductase